MVHAVRTIQVESGSELDRLLDQVADGPIELERNGARYRLDRVEPPLRIRTGEADDIWADYDPERAIAGMEAAFGSWSDIDAEALKAAIYRAREEGSRPPDRP